MRITTQENTVEMTYPSNNEQRCVLFISQTDSSYLPAQRLALLGWQVIQRNIELNADVQIEQCIIGIVHLGKFDSDFVARLKRLFLRHQNVYWLALVDKAELGDERLRELIRDYFYDFHCLPLDFNRLNIILGHAYGLAKLINESSENSIHPVDENGIVGLSPRIVQLRSLIKKAAASNAPVLICGESGTGKELVASSIHAHSLLRAKPFVAVNCASLPGSLIQSELFGHEKGAFTGAHAKKIGHIEAAAGGTLFLDEIGDLSPGLQVNLLRFLQEKKICRVGGHEEITVDARVIAATNVHLEKAIEFGSFRLDLYYRLNVIRIDVPPLRERQGDIELLAQHFLEKYKDQKNQKITGFSSEALHAMRQHHWPGNIRELINRIRRAMIMAERKLISPEDLDLTSQMTDHALSSLEAARDKAEGEAIMAMMAHTKTNMSEAARLLGVTRATLYRLITKHKILLRRPKDERVTEHVHKADQKD